MKLLLLLLWWCCCLEGWPHRNDWSQVTIGHTDSFPLTDGPRHGGRRWDCFSATGLLLSVSMWRLHLWKRANKKSSKSLLRAATCRSWEEPSVCVSVCFCVCEPDEEDSGVQFWAHFALFHWSWEEDCSIFEVFPVFTHSFWVSFPCPLDSETRRGQVLTGKW